MRETGFLNRSVAVGGATFPYQAYVPPDWTSARRWPVILFLHGVGECGDDGLLPTEVGLGTAIRRRARAFPCLAVFPQAPRGGDWTGATAAAALRAVDRTIAEFHGDPRRVYLTGLSMGGTGALRLAADHPRRFAAIVPVSACLDIIAAPPPPADVRAAAGARPAASAAGPAGARVIAPDRAIARDGGDAPAPLAALGAPAAPTPAPDARAPAEDAADGAIAAQSAPSTATAPAGRWAIGQRHATIGPARSLAGPRLAARLGQPLHPRNVPAHRTPPTAAPTAPRTPAAGHAATRTHSPGTATTAGTVATTATPNTDAGTPAYPGESLFALARAIGELPIWIFQGAEDTDPSPAQARRLADALGRLAGRVRYTEYPGVGHGAWDRAYAEPGLIPWLLAQRRSG